MTRASNRRRLVVRLALSLAIGGGLAWLLAAGGLPVVPARAAFDHLRPELVAGYLASLVVMHGFRASRWRHLLRPLAAVPLRTTMSVAWVGFAAVLLFPLRMGEVVRPALIARRSEVKGWEAAGTVAAERVMDGLFLSALLMLGLQITTPLSPLPERLGDLPVPVAAVPRAAYTALILFVAAFTVMLVFFWQRDRAVRFVRAVLGVVSARLADIAAGVVERVARGLDFLPSWGRLLAFAAETAGYWGAHAVGLWMLALGCGLPQVGIGEACVVMGCLGIGILVPSGPGYFGNFQLAGYLALAMYAPAAEVLSAGSAFVFIAYCAQVIQHALFGTAGLVIDRTTPRTVAPSVGATDESSD